jgi:hypothetical protein
MILMDFPPQKAETAEGYDFSEKSKVNILTLSQSTKEIGAELEYSKRSFFYFGILWLVSLWAMITNVAQAMFIKIFKKREDYFQKILWTIGRDPNHISSTFVDRFSRFNHQSKYGAAGWRALNVFYNYHDFVKPQLENKFEKVITKFWIEKMQNRQAVTNRLKVAVWLLSKAFSKFINEPEVRLVSIASGSAQAVVEAIKKSPQSIKAVLIDMDQTAIDEAKRIVREAGFESNFTFIKGDTSSVKKVCTEFKPHIIEMIGFLDYRPEKKAIKLVHKIYDCLPADGIFLTCNIRKNIEKIFLSWVLLWPMIYRNEKQFSNILINGGFSPEKVDLIYEPFKIHGIGVCQK